MSRRAKLWSVGALVLGVTACLGLVACEQAVQPTAIETENLTGLLSPGDQFLYTFTVSQTGNVSALIQNLSGQETLQQGTVGMGIGTWDDVNCAVFVRNQEATFNTLISGSALPGNYCLLLYDVGLLAEDVSYFIRLDHP